MLLLRPDPTHLPLLCPIHLLLDPIGPDLGGPDFDGPDLDGPDLGGPDPIGPDFGDLDLGGLDLGGPDSSHRSSAPRGPSQVVVAAVPIHFLVPADPRIACVSYHVYPQAAERPIRRGSDPIRRPLAGNSSPGSSLHRCRRTFLPSDLHPLCPRLAKLLGPDFAVSVLDASRALEWTDASGTVAVVAVVAFDEVVGLGGVGEVAVGEVAVDEVAVGGLGIGGLGVGELAAVELVAAGVHVVAVDPSWEDRDDIYYSKRSLLSSSSYNPPR